MNLTSPTIIKQLCREYNLQPSRRKGQNFLIDQNILDKIIEAADLQKNDIVLEIGPGLGCLTLELAKKVKRVIAVELDKRMVEILKEVVNHGIYSVDSATHTNVEIVNENILDYQVNPERSRGAKYKIVANLPYGITSRVLKKFLSEEPKPELMIVMIQKEVAERIMAKPGEMNLLALNCQLYAKPEILFQVSKNCFWPKPEVDSAVISLKPNTGLAWVFKPRRRLDKDIEKKFWQLAKIGFSSKRKKLINNLAAGLRLEKLEVTQKLSKVIDPATRAQNLSIEDWIKLSKVF